MKRGITFILIFLCITMPTLALEPEYAILPEFEVVQDFTEGLALVHKNGESAVINMYGKYVLPFDTSFKKIRSNGLIMVVGENDMAAFFDKYGNRKTEYIYDTYPVTHEKTREKTYYFTYSLEEGDGKSLLVPFSRDKKYGYIDETGREVVPPIYGFAGGFHNGIARIASMGILSPYGTYTNAKYGLILETGQEIVPPDAFWTAGWSELGYATASNGWGDTLLASPAGVTGKTDAKGYANIGVPYLFTADAEGRRGVVDKDGNTIIPLDFYERLEKTGRPSFIVNNKIIGVDGQQIFEAPEGTTLRAHYVSSVEKSHLVKIVKPANDGVDGHVLFGLVSANGNMILDLRFETVFDMGEGLIFAGDQNGNYLYDYFGKYLCTLHGNNCGQSKNGLFPITDFDTMKKGYMLNPLLCPKIYVDGEKITADVYPKTENNRTLVPMRAVFEAMGAKVDWEDETKTVIVRRQDITVTIAIGEKTLYKNGTPIEIDAPAKIENDRTLVPLRAISEALACNVKWDGEERTVNIRTDMLPDPPAGRPVKPFY